MSDKTQDVQDKPMEIGIKLNNILTFLVLGVMSWVGFNINSMKESIHEIQTVTQVQKTELNYLSEKLEQHLRDHKFKRESFFGDD